MEKELTAEIPKKDTKVVLDTRQVASVFVSDGVYKNVYVDTGEDVK